MEIHHEKRILFEASHSPVAVGFSTGLKNQSKISLYYLWTNFGNICLQISTLSFFCRCWKINKILFLYVLCLLSQNIMHILLQVQSSIPIIIATASFCNIDMRFISLWFVRKLCLLWIYLFSSTACMAFLCRIQFKVKSSTPPFSIPWLVNSPEHCLVNIMFQPQCIHVDGLCKQSCHRPSAKGWKIFMIEGNITLPAGFDCIFRQVMWYVIPWTAANLLPSTNTYTLHYQIIFQTFKIYNSCALAPESLSRMMHQ